VQETAELKGKIIVTIQVEGDESGKVSVAYIDEDNFLHKELNEDIKNNRNPAEQLCKSFEYLTDRSDNASTISYDWRQFKELKLENPGNIIITIASENSVTFSHVLQPKEYSYVQIYLDLHEGKDVADNLIKKAMSSTDRPDNWATKKSQFE